MNNPFKKNKNDVVLSTQQNSTINIFNTARPNPLFESIKAHNSFIQISQPPKQTQKNKSQSSPVKSSFWNMRQQLIKKKNNTNNNQEEKNNEKEEGQLCDEKQKQELNEQSFNNTEEKKKNIDIHEPQKCDKMNEEKIVKPIQQENNKYQAQQHQVPQQNTEKKNQNVFTQKEHTSLNPKQSPIKQTEEQKKKITTQPQQIHSLSAKPTTSIDAGHSIQSNRQQTKQTKKSQKIFLKEHQMAKKIHKDLAGCMKAIQYLQQKAKTDEFIKIRLKRSLQEIQKLQANIAK